jgi:drug/metabolite transporter (DMT)-like permease
MSRFGLGQVQPMTFVSLRLLLASLAFVTAYLIFRVRPIPRDPRLILKAGILGILGTVITMTGFTNALRYQSSGVTSLLVTLSPIMTVIMAHLVLKDEHFTRQRLFGALIAFCGAGLLLVRGENGLAQFAQADWRGYAWTLLGVTSNSVGLVYARRYLNQANSFDVTSIRIATGMLVVCAITAMTGGFDLSRLQWTGVLALVYAALAGTFLAFLLYLTTVQKFGATVASQTEYAVPMVATGLGVLLLHEQITLTMLVGMVVIFIGLAIFDRGRDVAGVPQPT